MTKTRIKIIEQKNGEHRYIPQRHYGDDWWLYIIYPLVYILCILDGDGNFSLWQDIGSFSILYDNPKFKTLEEAKAHVDKFLVREEKSKQREEKENGKKTKKVTYLKYP